MRDERDYWPLMTDPANPAEPLAALPHGNRIRSRRVQDRVATIIADSTGLSEAERAAMESEMRAAALGLSDIDEVRIAFSASRQYRPLIAIGSGKGGVGKSTVAANLAIAMARLGHRVGLIDADVYGPSQPTLLGSTEKPVAKGDQLVPVEAHGIKFLSLGQLTEPGQALAWRGPMASGAMLRLVEADWGDCDLLLVDLPPGTGDIQISLIQKSRPDGAVIVSTPQDLSLMDAERAVDLFNRVQVPVIGLIENMSGYHCPHCGEESDPFGAGGAEAGARRMHIPFLGKLPLSMALRTASDAGVPPALSDGEESALFRAMATKILAQLEKARA